jgi:hypothetical protein
VRRLLLLLVIAAIGVTGCSKSSHESTAAPPTPTTSTAPQSKASIAELDRKLCSAFDAFWNTSYSGGEPSATMLARERALVNAAEATPDQRLHDSMRELIDGELGLPKFLLHDTAHEYQQKRNQLPPDVRAALDAVELNDRAVESRCGAVGRPINT